MLSLDNEKSRLKFFFALFTLVFILFASSPVVAFANEGNYVGERVRIIDKDNYYTDEEKQELKEKLGRTKEFHKVIEFIAPVDNEDVKKLSFQEMLDTEYPDFFLDRVDVAVYAPWLEGEYAGAYCEMRGSRYSKVHKCSYLENVDSAKERDGSVDNMVSLVKVMQEERFEKQREHVSSLSVLIIVLALLPILIIKVLEFFLRP